MMANNEIGTIQPIKKFSEIAHAHGAWFHTDAVQAVGHIPINVRAMGIDMLSVSAHKFNGPKGIGFLYSKNGLLQPFHNGGSQDEGRNGKCSCNCWNGCGFEKKYCSDETKYCSSEQAD